MFFPQKYSKIFKSVGAFSKNVDLHFEKNDGSSVSFEQMLVHRLNFL
jgi:hypothetical protein